MYTLDKRIRQLLWSLAAEFAYMAIVGTRILPPRSLLRRHLARVITPEMISTLALKMSDDDTVRLNSTLGVKLGGMPKCEILNDVLPELYQLCHAVRARGGESLYKIVDVVVPLAISAATAGFEEGDVLLASYRAAAYGRDRDMDLVTKYFPRWHIVKF